MKLSTVGLNRTFILFGVISVFCLLRPALSCQCTSQTTQDQETGQPIGICLTRAQENGRLFCYVNATSDCFDKRPSVKTDGLFWSSHACELAREPQVIGAIAASAVLPAIGISLGVCCLNGWACCPGGSGRKKRSVMHEYSDYNEDSYKAKSQYGANKGYDAGRSHSYQSAPIYGNNYEKQDYVKPTHEYSDYDYSYKSKSQYGEHNGYDAGRSHSYQSAPIYGNNYEKQDYGKPKHGYSDYDDSYKSKSQHGEHKGYGTGRSHSNYDQQDYVKPHISYLEDVYEDYGSDEGHGYGY